MIAVTESGLVRGQRGPLVSGYRWVGKGKKEGDRTGRGVGWLIKDAVNADQIQGVSDNDRIAWVVVKGARYKWAFGVVYCQQSGARECTATNKTVIHQLQKDIAKLRGMLCRICLVGDFNAHVANEEGVLTGVNDNGKLFERFCDSNCLEAVNFYPETRGMYTWERDGVRTVIDYVLVGSESTGYVRDMVIDEDGDFDINSDHNVILFTAVVGDVNVENTPPKPKLKWDISDKTPWGKFRAKLQPELEEWSKSWRREGAGEKVDEVVQSWVAVIHRVARETIGFKQGTGNKLGRGIPQQIRLSINKRRVARKRERLIRRRGGGLQELMMAKADRRRAIKDAKEAKRRQWKNERDKFFQEVDNSEKGVRNFWRYWAKLKNKNMPPNDQGLQDGDGVMVYGTQASEVLTAHLRALNEAPNKTFKGGGERSESGIQQGDPISIGEDCGGEDQCPAALTDPITEDDVVLGIKKLKMRKAQGMDQIPNEILKFGGESLVSSLVSIFNMVLDKEVVPCVWKKSRITMLHKGGAKTNIDNYRGINITSTVGKLFTKILAGRLEREVEEQNILGDIQFGFRRGKRSTDALFILSQLIHMRKARGKKLALAFLDVRKAYDTVPRDKLWDVLRKKGFGGKFLRLIISLYSKGTALATLGTIQSDEINLNYGLRQGCVLSPIFFAIYIQELGERLQQTGAGVTIANTVIPGMFFADDIVLIARDGLELRRELDIAGNFMQERGLQFNAEKSKVLINWRDPRSNSLWKLSEGIKMGEAWSYRYLGVSIALRGKTFKDHLGELRGRARYTGMAIRNISRGAVNGSFCAKQGWEKIALTSISYGAEIIIPTKKVMRELEVEQLKMGRFITGTSRRAANCGIRSLLRWHAIESLFDRIFLVYGRRFEFADEGWGKSVWQWVLEDTIVLPWKTRWRSLLTKYGLHGVVYDSPRAWKRLVKRHIVRYAQRLWSNVARTKKSLRYYALDTNSWGVAPPVYGSPGFKAMCQLMIGDVWTVDKRLHVEGTSVFHCRGCGKLLEDDLEHIYMKCVVGARERELVLQRGFYGSMTSTNECISHLIGMDVDVDYEGWLARFAWAESVIKGRRQQEAQTEPANAIYVLIISG